MRKVLSLMHMSLDGFVANSKGEMSWIKHDDEVFAHVDQFIEKADTGLYGPITFQMMESYWPGALKDPKTSGHHLTHAKWYEKAEKIVFSKKLRAPQVQNARLINDNLTKEIENLKKKPGKNIIIFGSPRLVQSFLQLGLIDEFLININPLILGGGLPMFAQSQSGVNLQLLSSTKFECG